MVEKEAQSLIENNPQIDSYTGKNPPYGYLDWWPTSLHFNNQRPEYQNPDLKWGIAYAINQDQLIEVGQGGSGQTSDVVFPYYAGLMPYYDNIQDILAEKSPTDFDLDKINCDEKHTDCGHGGGSRCGCCVKTGFKNGKQQFA